MDFHSLKRKELQALCKQNKIKANSTNLEMANNLTRLFKEKEKRKIETNEVLTETESSSGVVSKIVKKVRFSPENEVIEFTRSHKLKRSRKSMVSCRKSNLAAQSVEELNGDSVDRTVKTGSGGKAVLENVDNVVVSKKGGKKVIVDGKSEEQVRVGKIETMKENVDNGRKRGRPPRGVVDTTENRESVGKMEDSPVEIKALTENVGNGRKIGRKKAVVDELKNQVDVVGNDESRVGNRRSLRSKGIASDGNLAIGVETKNDGNVEVRPVEIKELMLTENVDNGRKRGRMKAVVDKVENQVDVVGNDENGVGNRRSLRSKGTVSDGNLATGEETKNDGKGKEEALVRISKRGVSTVGSLNKVVETTSVGVEGKVETVVQNQGSDKVELRRSRRKSVMPSLELRNLETEARNEEVAMPSRVVRTSRCKEADANPVSGMIETDEPVAKPSATVQTKRPKRHVSDTLEVADDIIQRKNVARKKKKVNVSKKDVVIDDSSHNRQPTTVVSFVKKPSSSMKESVLLDGSLQAGVTEHRESLTDQLSVPKVTSGSEQKCLGESTEASKLNPEIQDNSNVNSNPLTDMDCMETSNMKDIHSEEDFLDVVAEIVNFTVESDVQERNEEIITVADNGILAAQTTSQTVISTFYANCEEVIENSNVCENEVSPDLEGVEADAEESIGSEANFLHLVSEHKGACVQENPCPVEPVLIYGARLPLASDTELLVAPCPCHGTDSSHNTQCITGASDKTKQSSSTKESVLLDGSLRAGVTEHIESLAAQLSVPKVTSGSKQKCLIECIATTKLNREIQDNSNVKSLADMDDTKTSKMKNLNREDVPDVIARNANLTVESDVRVLNEEIITAADNGILAAHTTNQIDVANCEEVTENTNVGENEVSPDLKGVKADAEEIIGSEANLLHLVSEREGACAQENPCPVELVLIYGARLPLASDTELLVAPSPCHGRDTEKTHKLTPMRWSETENCQTKYDLNDFDCLNESSISLVHINDDSAEKSGAPKNSGGYDTSFDQCQSDDKDGETKIGGDMLAVSNISGDNMSMEKNIDGEHGATQQAGEISHDYTHGPDTLADNRNCNSENEASVEAQNAQRVGFNVTIDVCSFIQNEELKMDGEKENECEKSHNGSPVSERKEHVLRSLFATPMDKASGSESTLKATSNQEDVCTVKGNVITETMSSDRIDRGRGVEFEKFITESLVFEANDHEVRDAVSMAETDETGLCSLFATPKITEDSYKVNEFCRSESILEESDENVLQLLFATPIKEFSSEAKQICGSESKNALEEYTVEKVCLMKQNASHEEVGVAGLERTNNLSPEASNIMSSAGGKLSEEELGQNGHETELRLPFATPTTLEACKVNDVCGSESKHEEFCLEKLFRTQQIASHAKAGGSYLDILNTECIAGNDETDLQLLRTTPNNVKFSSEANKLPCFQTKNAFEECAAEKVCPMKLISSQEEVKVAGLELMNNFSAEAPNSEVLVDTEVIDNIACPTESRVNCEEELVQCRGEFNIGSENQTQVSVATLSDNLNSSIEKEDSVDVEISIDDEIGKLEVTSLSEGKFQDEVFTATQDQNLLGGNLSEDETGQNGQENKLLILSSTPNKCEPSFEAKDIFGSETKLQESCLEKASREKDANGITAHQLSNAARITEQYEVDLQLLFETPSKADVSDHNETCAFESKLEKSCMEKVETSNGSMKDEDLNLVNGVEVENLESIAVPPVANAFETSKQSWMGKTYGQKKEPGSLGHKYADEESKDGDHKSAEIISTIASSLENVSPMNCLIAGAFSFDDPTNLKVDLEGMEAEAEESIGPKADFMDLISEHKGVCAQEKSGRTAPFIYDASLPLGRENGSDMELLVAPSPCPGTDTVGTLNRAPIRWSETENSQTKYDQNDFNCLEESIMSPVKINEDTADKSGAPKNSGKTGGYDDTSFDQCLSDDKDGDTGIIDGEHEATQQAEEISNDTYESEIDLQLLFATPNKADVSDGNETYSFECKLEESCMKNVSPNNDLEVANLDSCTVLPVANAFEASKETWTGETYGQKKETVSLSLEHIGSLGQIYHEEESKVDDHKSAEIISTVASSLENRDEICDEKSLDINLSENLKLTQGSELSPDIANIDTVQKSINDPVDNHYFASYSQSSNVKRVTSTDASVEPTGVEKADAQSRINAVTDHETGPTILDEDPLFSNLDMHLLSRDSDYEISNCSQEMDGKDILGSSTHELVNKLSFQNELGSRFDVLKESDVMETIQEYTNNESSNSIDIDSSHVSVAIKASTDESKISDSVDEPNEESILDKVSALRGVSTAKKTARTILIHGTPNKAVVTADMKENDPLNKRPHLGDITITRPAKRRALQDI